MTRRSPPDVGPDNPRHGTGGRTRNAHARARRRPAKALTEIAGRTLLDRLLDWLEHAGMTRIVINLHHKAERISDHLAQRDGAEIVYSDERTELLETGGGVKKAFALLGPILFRRNGDILWQENADILAALRAGFDVARMDALLMLAPFSACTGYDGQGDFDQHADGRLARRQGGKRLLFSAGCRFCHLPLSSDTQWRVLPQSYL